MIPRHLLIINYHKVEEKTDIGITTRTPADFNSDLDNILRLGYKTITFRTLNDGHQIPDKPIIITFDDAYESFYTLALKSLKERDMSAVVYVPTAFIDKYNDWDVQFGQKRYKHLDTQQIMDISKEGIEIGSHGINHLSLVDIPESCAEKEMKHSKELLEELTDEPVISFSYPFGRYNSDIMKITKKYYKYGVGLLGKTCSSEYESCCLPRINIYRQDSRTEFNRKLNYFNDTFIRLKTRMIQQGAKATVLMQKIRRN